jgi:hypothetical protein
VGVRTKASKKNPEGIERHGLYKCRDCRSQFTVRIGTIFEESHLELHKWLQAIHLMTSSKKGISAHQLHRNLEVTDKTAWFLAIATGRAMRSDDFTPMGGNGKTVEADGTFIGRLSGTPKQSGAGGAQPGDRTMVDALKPAFDALGQGAGLEVAARRAREGADATGKMLRAGAGRSSYLDARSLEGINDPRAEAVARIFESLARC